MIWSEIRAFYPNQWLVIEAVEAYTTDNNQRQLTNIAIIETAVNGTTAMQKYRALHTQFPNREFYFVNTQRETLDIRERQWVGIRGHNAVTAKK